MHADKHQSFYKLALLLLMEMTRQFQITQSTSIVIQNIQIFYGSPVMIVVTCSYIAYVFPYVVLFFLQGLATLLKLL